MSETQTEVKNLLKGGEFLVKTSNYIDTFTPEDLNEEQQMIIDTVVSFVENEIVPIYDKIETQEPGVAVSLLEKAGE